MSTDPIFQKSLQDVIKGIRAHKRDAGAFISQLIADIKVELKSTDPFVKGEAIRKLTYIQMLGYNISWASFGIVEVMSQSRFLHKRIGYLAACQSFTENTDVVLLTTNLFKKEFASAQSNQYEIGLAINCLANIATPDLARDCIGDLVNLMSHSRPYVRKKAVLSMYKLYIKYPQGLRLTFDKLKERLDDPEPSVVSTAVNVICELANRNPQNYLAMAPKFFKLLTTSSNNWMLIKVVKLLGSLVSEEPRLARKLLEPLATIIQNTSAKSLQYECIQTVTEALPHTKRDDGSDSKNAPQVVELCSNTLKGFIEDADQNLKYLGLVGLVSLMRSNPKAVVDHRELVLRCLNDDDVTIRSRALELLAGIVSRKSLVDLVHHLMEHVRHSEGSYRDEIIAKILLMCSKDKYALVTDFAWYTSVLLSLAVMQGGKHGQQVADQLIEVGLRVDSVRHYAVESMLSMLMNDALILGQARATVSEVLKAAAWIVGEYSDTLTSIARDVDVVGGDEDGYFWIQGPTGEDIRSAWRGKPVHTLVLKALLHPRATNLPPHVQSVYVLSATKVFLRACADCPDAELEACLAVLRSSLGVFLQSPSVEVQERASTLRHVLAEFDILELGWETAVEAAKRAADDEKQRGKQAAALDDLLDMPAYSMDVAAVDTKGAKAAKSKRRPLAALSKEPFYAVHSKAQKRVPVPEGLNLDGSLDAAALKELLAIDIPESLTLQTLCFTERPPAPPIPDRNPFDDDEVRIGNLAKSSFGVDYATGQTKSYAAFDGDHSNMTAPPQGRSAEDNLFYLVGKGGPAADLRPLSQVLAETFEDSGKKGKKDKKDKKDKKKDKHLRPDEINTREFLPAGAAADSDDEGRGKGKSKSKAHKPSRKGEASLDFVDITSPLGQDEVLPVLRHREVTQSAPAAAPVADDSKSKSKDKDKSGKKSKEGKESKDKEGKKSKKDKSGAGAGVAVMDLLSMDSWGSSSSSTATAPAATAPSTATAPASKAPAAPKIGKVAWSLVSTDRGVTVFSSLSATSTSLSVCFKAINNNPEGAKCSVEVVVGSGGGVTGCGVLRLVDSGSGAAVTAGGGGTALASGSCAIAGPLVSTAAPTLLPITVRVSLEGGLVGADVRSAEAALKVSLVAGFLPHKLGADDFAALLGKKAGHWGEGKVKVPVPAGAKAKSTLKAIGLFLRSHCVEEEVSKAASFVCKTLAGGGGSVCCLGKCSKDGSTVSVEVKALCSSSKQESQAVADAVCAALATAALA